jgi:excisionase family DNA binding protein
MTIRLEDEPIVLTVPQAARILQVSENHLYSLIAQDLVPHLRFGKLIRIPRWGLLKYIADASGAPLAASLANHQDQSVHAADAKTERDLHG